ncbi:hypothetical protein AAVH_11058 [Aphelenchoides avenae]|nr:hypothetical protein AAVH_11058 [Aphelenchus avenae]
MLPAEVLADCIDFHKLFDLSASMMTNSTFSHLAVSAAKHLRWWRILDLRLVVHPKFIIVKTTPTDPILEGEFDERIVIKKKNADELIAIALTNCVIDKLSIHCFKTTNSDDVIAATRRAAGSVVVNKLVLYGKCFACEDEALVFAESLQSIQELSVVTTINRDATVTGKVIGLKRRSIENYSPQPQITQE